jgi:mRNA-degrading endonuclease YafQ of YafQ-DinJ toxin-antitoxin module
VAGGYRTLELAPTFVESLIARDFSEADRKRFVRALRLLDDNEQHPSLRVHELRGDMAGTWSASASDQLRMTFLRMASGRKLMLTCSRHYAR